MNARIAVITGFHQSPSFLIPLFDCLNKQSYTHFDVFIYNYKYDELKDLSKNRYRFTYKVIKLERNMGFSGGNNAAIKFAKKQFDYDFYALINDDTKPAEDWLIQLVSTALGDSAIGAVASKILYYEPYIVLSGKTKTSNENDKRHLGVRWYSNSRFSASFFPKVFYLKGFNEIENDELNNFRWTKSDFRVALPISSSKQDESLRLFLRKNVKIENQELELSIGKKFKQIITLSDNQFFYPVTIPCSVIEENLINIVQNAGSDYDKNYNGFDIGSGELDTGQYNDIKDVNMFCGCSVLLSKEALHKTGLFADYFFSYYEDSDLSIRLKKGGYKIIYQPLSVIRHYHAASGKEWSPFFTYHVFRNKIIFCAKNFGFKAFLFALKERIDETILFLKWARRQKFRDKELNQRIKLNFRILFDAVKGIVRYKPSKL